MHDSCHGRQDLGTKHVMMLFKDGVSGQAPIKGRVGLMHESYHGGQDLGTGGVMMLFEGGVSWRVQLEKPSSGWKKHSLQLQHRLTYDEQLIEHAYERPKPSATFAGSYPVKYQVK